ncbi:MAG: hypothetical protein GF350_09180 [Chitinivibrionales bacterium]|nr:hypothetical protein [Chitinivibrionales bacterium]
MPSLKKVTIELDLPEGLLAYKVDLKPGPVKLHHVVRKLLRFCDEVNELGEGIAAQFGKKIACGPSCGACCRQMVPLSPPEAAHIAEIVNSLPKDKKKEIIARFTGARQKLARSGVLEKMTNLYMCTASDEEILEVNREYFEQNIECPFLENGSCSIHRVRPSRCREYSVLTPKELCRDPFDRQIKRLPVTVRLCESITYAWASLTGNRPRIIPLVDALFQVDSNPDMAMRTIDKPEPLVRAILEHACDRANKRAHMKMKKSSNKLSNSRQTPGR